MVYSTKHRFMAGAVCPRCSEMDKLVVYNEAGKDFRECISCGFKDEMNFKPVKRELETRVSQSDPEKNNELQIIRIIPLEKG